MNKRYLDWCDPGPRGSAPIVDPAHPSRGTCPKCGYVGLLNDRSGALYPHKRFDRYAPDLDRHEFEEDDQ